MTTPTYRQNDQEGRGRREANRIRLRKKTATVLRDKLMNQLQAAGFDVRYYVTTGDAYDFHWLDVKPAHQTSDSPHLSFEISEDGLRIIDINVYNENGDDIFDEQTFESQNEALTNGLK